jgi:hypothetical protein
VRTYSNDPLTLPKWHALGREAELAAEQIANGITALGRASHAQKGRYNQAFFGLSVGIERLAKIIFVADYATQHDGDFPTDNILRSQFGHEIVKLLDFL